MKGERRNVSSDRSFSPIIVIARASITKLCHREGFKARGDPLALRKQTTGPSASQGQDGLGRPSLRSLLAITKTTYHLTPAIANLLRSRQSAGFGLLISFSILSSHINEDLGYFFAYLVKAIMKNQIQNPKTRPMKINAMSFLPFDTFG